MDLERSAFSENALQYQAGLSFITHQLKMLMSSVQG
jgi:flagellar basal body rod protein FlgB